MKSELARTTQITVRPAAPTPQEMLHLTSSDEQDIGGDFRWNKEDKAAQRGGCCGNSLPNSNTL